MNYLPLITTVALLNFLGAVSPGPDFIIVVRNTLNHSAKAGIFTGIGIGLSLLVHITYCSVGIGLLISKSVVLFNVIKYLGAAYLAYLGVMSLRFKTSEVRVEGSGESISFTSFQALKTGFLTNLLNPKATLFILGLFSFVISPQVPVWVIMIIAVIIVLTAISWFTLVSVFFTHREVKKLYFRYEKWANLLLGFLLILLALKVAFIR